MSVNVEELVADLQATVQYIGDITERADSMSFDEAVSAQDELRRVKAAADESIRMIDGQIAKRLEAGGPRQFGSRVFARAKKYVDRHDHDHIASIAYRQAIEAATDPDTGEVNSQMAIKAGIQFMRKVYLSPSDQAKVTPLKKLGVERSEYESKEFKEWVVSVTETDPG